MPMFPLFWVQADIDKRINNIDAAIILLIVFIFGFFGFVKDIIRYGIDSIEDYENSSYYDRSTYDYDYYDYYDDIYKID